MIFSGAVAYLALGALFAVPFLGWGAARMDAGIAASGVGARIMLLPGVIALWPVLMLRWLSGLRFEG